MRYVLIFALALPLVPGLDARSAAKKAAPAKASFTKAQLAFYDKEVAPILQKHCIRCHGEKRQRGKMRLDSRAGLLKGGELGPAIDVKNLDKSLILKAINWEDKVQMPESGKLPTATIAILTKWVKMGAPHTGKAPTETTEHVGMKVTDKDRAYWAYRPLKRPELPKVKDTQWVDNPIDAFILARLEARGLKPNPRADRRTLIRRSAYDLVGLPPSPAQVDAFVKDTRPGAYSRLLDNLLASSQHGAKWGRHWLDLVRFAETHGYERDSLKPFAWRFRDYVIDSINANKPYDRFLIEQLAGDELDTVNAETLAATGYYRLGLWDDEPADPLLAKYDILDGIASTTAQVVMGMTIGCARCHDHKKDPIPQRDYYRFLAFFHDITPMNRTNLRRVATEDDQKKIARLREAKQAREGKIYQQLYSLEQQFLAATRKKGIETRGLLGADIVDLTYRFYRDTWETLPDFDNLKHEDSGKVANGYFTLAPASRSEAIGLVFEGKLKVPQKGGYTFTIEATEGFRLKLDGKTVLDKPGKGRQSGIAKADLKAGLIPIRLEYFNTYQTPSLRVTWSGPGVGERTLSDDGAGQGTVLIPDSRKQAVEWKYTTGAPGRTWQRHEFDDGMWKKGKAGFGRRGTPGAVVRTTWTSRDIYLRKKFDVKELPARLALDLHHDDHVEVYLNFKLIYKATGYLTSYRRILLDERATKAIRKGSNTLSIHCQQTFGGQYIDAGLVADSRMSMTDLIRTHGETLLGAAQVKKHATLRAALEQERKAILPNPGIEVMSVEESGKQPVNILIRGNPHAKGAVVTAGVPEVLPSKGLTIVAPKNGRTSGKRLALAKWLTSSTNPVTARVMANRLWQFHFGRGLVPTSSDFGKLGEAPTHPELIDWLACELIDSGWDLKYMHRLIMTSATYKMSSRGRKDALAKDPGNNLYWRFNMRRLTAEEVRDSVLSVSGELNLRLGGPGIFPTIPRDVLAGQSRPGDGWGKSSRTEAARRSVFVHVKRSLLVPILESHDSADTDSSCAVRYTTTVPTQALGMLNGDFTHEQAALFAARLMKEAPGGLKDQIARAIRLTTGRIPSVKEIKDDMAFVEELRKENNLDATKALTMYALLALNTNEFIYLD